MMQMQEIDLSVKKLVGPEDDVYYKHISGIPLDTYEPLILFSQELS